VNFAGQPAEVALPAAFADARIACASVRSREGGSAAGRPLQLESHEPLVLLA
jgi:hypothetical protein